MPACDWHDAAASSGLVGSQLQCVQQKGPMTGLRGPRLIFGGTLGLVRHVMFGGGFILHFVWKSALSYTLMLYVVRPLVEGVDCAPQSKLLKGASVAMQMPSRALHGLALFRGAAVGLHLCHTACADSSPAPWGFLPSV